MYNVIVTRTHTSFFVFFLFSFPLLALFLIVLYARNMVEENLVHERFSIDNSCMCVSVHACKCVCIKAFFFSKIVEYRFFTGRHRKFHAMHGYSIVCLPPSSAQFNSVRSKTCYIHLCVWEDDLSWMEFFLPRCCCLFIFVLLVCFLYNGFVCMLYIRF